MRKYWPHFIQDTEVLVFVVDSTDRKRFPQAYDEMHKLLGEPRLEEKPVIVLANKQVKMLQSCMLMCLDILPLMSLCT